MSESETYYSSHGERRGSAIVFDPSTQTVSTRKLKKLPADKFTSTQSAPKWSSHVPIYVDQDDTTKRLAATLDLGKLGWANNVMRLCGKYSQIVVMELPDTQPSGLVDAS